MRAGGQLISAHPHRGGKREFMFGAVQLENAVQLNRRLSLRLDSTSDSDGCESRFRVLPALQNILVHFVVAAAAAAVATGDVDHHQAAGLACCGVEPDGPALQFEGPTHGVKNVGQGEFNVRLRRVEFQHSLLRVQGGRYGKRKDNRSPGESVS